MLKPLSKNTHKYINYTWQHSHKPVHPSQPADHRLSRGHHHQDQAQTAAQQQKLINILYKLKSCVTLFWLMVFKNLHIHAIKAIFCKNISRDCTPWFWQCTPLVPRTGPAHPAGCLRRHRNGWPPQSGPSNPNHHRDLQHRIREQSGYEGHKDDHLLSMAFFPHWMLQQLPSFIYWWDQFNQSV